MALLDRLKRDISRHRAKAVVLAVLFVTMVGFAIKAFFELQPRGADAAVLPSHTIALDSAKPAASSVATDQDIKDSAQLWQKLREVKPEGASATLAFTFNADFYAPLPPDLSRRAASAPPEPAEAKTPVPPPVDRQATIREQARALVVKSTSLGNGTAPAVAIVNQQLLTIGQQILGFEIIAIRARAVEFSKDGVTVLVKMSDELRGQ